MTSSVKENASQKQFLVNYLRGTGREITAQEAKSEFNICNLRARVSELRSAGLRVATRKNEDGTASYRIAARLQNGSRAAIEV